MAVKKKCITLCVDTDNNEDHDFMLNLLQSFMSDCDYDWNLDDSYLDRPKQAKLVLKDGSTVTKTLEVTQKEYTVSVTFTVDADDIDHAYDVVAELIDCDANYEITDCWRR